MSDAPQSPRGSRGTSAANRFTTVPLVVGLAWAASLWVIRRSEPTFAATPDPAVVQSPNRPPTPLVIENQCPGEGCSFGGWLACGPVPVYAAEGDTSRVAFAMTRNETFEAVTGNMHVVRPGLVVVRDSTPAAAYAIDPVIFLPGDTAYVLHYVGEGFFSVWYRGRTIEAQAFWRWQEWEPADQPYAGDLVSEGATEWWVSVRGTAGEGWIRATDAPIAVANALDPDDPACREQ